MFLVIGLHDVEGTAERQRDSAICKVRYDCVVNRVIADPCQYTCPNRRREAKSPCTRRIFPPVSHVLSDEEEESIPDDPMWIVIHKLAQEVWPTL